MAEQRVRLRRVNPVGPDYVCGGEACHRRSYRTVSASRNGANSHATRLPSFVTGVLPNRYRGIAALNLIEPVALPVWPSSVLIAVNSTERRSLLILPTPSGWANPTDQPPSGVLTP